jgi:hypothetical protein
MSVGALAGLALLNLLFLASGTAVLWAFRGFATLLDVGRLAGLAYLVGVACVGSIWVLLLIVAVPFSNALVVLVPVALSVLAILVGRRYGRGLPEVGSVQWGPQVVVTAFGIAVVGVLLEAGFRSARLAGLYAWDAWSFWVPKAKAIYFFSELDEQFFTTLPGSSYPPLLPVLDAAAFHVMGSPDVVTLHVQHWLYGVGFTWALAGLLSTKAPAWILWPFVTLVVVAPRIGPRLDVPEADLLLDFFFVLAAVLMWFWLLDRSRWQLAAATVLLSGMVLTKREGLLLGAVLVVATLLASGRDIRAVWRPLAAMTAIAAAVGLPWRIWYVVQGVGAEGPSTSGLDPTENVSRLWPSIRLAIDVLADAGYWSGVTLLALAALVLAALARTWSPVVFFGSLVVLVTLAGGWITWAIPELEITEELGANPIVRFMGAAALACIAATPMLLTSAWQAAGRSTSEAGPARNVPLLATGVVVVALVGYPLLALSGGSPRFPTRGECVTVAGGDAPDLNVVYGRFDDLQPAEALLADVTRTGFTGAELTLDNCGQWTVAYDAIESYAQGQALADQVRAAGFDAQVEVGG